MTDFDVIVVGAGVEGSSTAYHLCKRGKKVLILEQYPLGHGRGSSHGHSRILRRAYPTHHAHYTPMTTDCIPMWRQLEQETGQQIYRRTGVLSVTFDPKVMQNVETSLKQTQVPYTKLSNADLRTTYPMIGEHVSSQSEAMVEEDGGVVYADKALQSYWKMINENGGVIHDSEKVLEIVPGETVLVRTPKKEYRARSVVLTAGPWAPKLLKPLGVDVPLKPMRITAFYWREKTPGMFHADRFPVLRYVNVVEHAGMLHNLYGLPADEYPGLFKLCLHTGITVDPESRDSVQFDDDAKLMCAFIRKHIPELHPVPSIIDKCYYTMTPDSEFILDRHPRFRNIIIGAGFSGHGFKLSPVVGEILANLVTNEEQRYDMKPFRLSRFTKEKKSKL